MWMTWHEELEVLRSADGRRHALEHALVGLLSAAWLHEWGVPMVWIFVLVTTVGVLWEVLGNIFTQGHWKCSVGGILWFVLGGAIGGLL